MDMPKDMWQILWATFKANPLVICDGNTSNDSIWSNILVAEGAPSTEPQKNLHPYKGSQV